MGEYVEVDVEGWWCPTTLRWESCPGPCPDGTKHERSRTHQVMARVVTAAEARRS